MNTNNNTPEINTTHSLLLKFNQYDLILFYYMLRLLKPQKYLLIKLNYNY